MKNFGMVLKTVSGLLILFQLNAFATPVTKTCAGLLKRYPRLAERAINLFSSLNASHHFLPQSIVHIRNDDLTEADLEAIRLSRFEHGREVAFFEAVDGRGQVLLRSKFETGSTSDVDIGNGPSGSPHATEGRKNEP